jgi:hypothetical protein
MPDDRLIHLAFGHSEKANKLTDADRLVWLMYKLASDDFGIMRFSAMPLQAAARFLEKRSAKAVLRSLETIRDVGLVRTFVSQGTVYAYQWDWQSWQKITHPRQTKQPKPPPDLLAVCDSHTRWLFSHHPKGGKLKSWQAPELDRETTGSKPGDDTEKTGPVWVGSGGGRGSDRESGDDRARVAFTGKVLEVPRFLDEEFAKRLNGQAFNLPEFYQALDGRLAQTGEPWDLRWIRDRFSAESPVPTRTDDRPISIDERRKAEDYRRSVGCCTHEPRCDSVASCIALIVRLWREQEREVLRG